MPRITPKKREKNRDQLAEIRADRQLKEQDLGWLFRPLAVCPFPAAPQGKRIIIEDGKRIEEFRVLWTRRASNIKVEVLGHPEYGIPYGQDALVVLYLAYEARRQGSRKIKVNFYRDFMRMFEMNPNSGRKYQLVVESLRRIRHASFSWEVDGDPVRERGLHFLYIDEYDLYCDPKRPDQRMLFDQYIILSERFWEEIRTHRIPSNLKAIVYLKGKPAHLNFYIWLSYRIGTIYHETVGKGLDPITVHIPFWGPQGLQEQMSSVVERRNDFRVQVKKWLLSVQEVWPKCPAEIEGDSLRIQVENEDQLDVQNKDTEAPRIMGRRKPAPALSAPTSPCPVCGALRTLQPGRINRQNNVRYPDWWKCAGGCQAVPADARCPDCGRTMEEKNRGRVDYYYQCECGLVKAGEDYWLQRGLASQPETPEE